MDNILKMNTMEFIQYFRKIQKQDFLQLIQEVDKLLQLDIGKFNLIYLNVNSNFKKLMLDDALLFERLMEIAPNRMGKSIIDLSDEKIQNYIYNHENLLHSINGKKLLEQHLRKLTSERFDTLLENENLNLLYERDVLKEVAENYSLDTYQFCVVETAVKTGRFSSLAMLRFKNNYEVFLYAKFGLLLSVREVRAGKCWIGDSFISCNFLERVNRKHLVSLIALMRKKDDSSSNEILFIGVSKLYMTLGFDNSKKVIQDFFTYGTKASIIRASDELFKDTRRAYRLKNQHKFYYYGMEYDFLRSLKENDVSYFLEFCNKNKKDVELFLKTIKSEIKTMDDKENFTFIKEIILKEIQLREKRQYDKDTEKYQQYYQKMVRTEPIKVRDLYNIFGNIELDYRFSKGGKLIANDTLVKFLLGNCKKDNDCLLRMVLNREALGLNDELYQVLNNFNEIKKIIDDETNLSIFSILDIIDVLKVFLYRMCPDELDITLETFSKILNSRKYCTEKPEDILKRVMVLHKKRKRRIASSIPSIKGEVLGAKYWVSDFDDERLLVSGIDTGSCFKVGGKGEDFFEYCLTNPKGLVFYIEYYGLLYILPSTVNGNMLNINSIDPKISDEKIYLVIMNVVKEMAQEIVMNPQSQVEMVTITDIHHEKFMRNSGYQKVIFEKFIPLDTDVYCDYNKKEVTNYVVYRRNASVKPRYFLNQDLFYQERPESYVISPKHEYDRERINILLNSIAYSSIDFMDISEEEKIRERYFYQSLNVLDFVYVVGSKDWFIGIDKDGKVVSYLLYYDERATEEFEKYWGVIQHFIQQNNVKKIN